jgi:hypothetical protein
MKYFWEPCQLGTQYADHEDYRRQQDGYTDLAGWVKPEGDKTQAIVVTRDSNPKYLNVGFNTRAEAKRYVEITLALEGDQP